jgi:hypothetical protein
LKRGGPAPLSGSPGDQTPARVFTPLQRKDLAKLLGSAAAAERVEACCMQLQACGYPHGVVARPGSDQVALRRTAGRFARAAKGLEQSLSGVDRPSWDVLLAAFRPDGADPQDFEQLLVSLREAAGAAARAEVALRRARPGKKASAGLVRFCRELRLALLREGLRDSKSADTHMHQAFSIVFEAFGIERDALATLQTVRGRPSRNKGQ